MFPHTNNFKELIKMETVYTSMIFKKWNTVHLKRENPRNTRFFSEIKKTTKPQHWQGQLSVDFLLTN